MGQYIDIILRILFVLCLPYFAVMTTMYFFASAELAIIVGIIVAILLAISYGQKIYKDFKRR